MTFLDTKVHVREKVKPWRPQRALFATSQRHEVNPQTELEEDSGELDTVHARWFRPHNCSGYILAKWEIISSPIIIFEKLRLFLYSSSCVSNGWHSEGACDRVVSFLITSSVDAQTPRI